MSNKVTIEGPTSEVEGFLKTLRELQADKARMDWLESQKGHVFGHGTLFRSKDFSPISIREKIDEMLQKDRIAVNACLKP